MSAPTYMNAEQQRAAEIAASLRRLANMLQTNPTLAAATAAALGKIDVTVGGKANSRVVLGQARLAGKVYADDVAVEHDVSEVTVTLAFGEAVRVGYTTSSWNMPVGFTDLDPLNGVAPDLQVPA